MNASLIQTACSNRIAALEYLQARKQRGCNEAQILDISTMREKLRKKPVFLTRRQLPCEERHVA